MIALKNTTLCYLEQDWSWLLLHRNKKKNDPNHDKWSGIGGKFPKDLLIGKAVEVKPEENDVSLYATVEPFVDIKTVRDVIIIPSFNGQGEVAAYTDTNNASSNGG